MVITIFAPRLGGLVAFCCVVVKVGENIRAKMRARSFRLVTIISFSFASFDDCCCCRRVSYPEAYVDRNGTIPCNKYPDKSCCFVVLFGGTKCGG